jgi:hypothetical protein
MGAGRRGNHDAVEMGIFEHGVFVGRLRANRLGQSCSAHRVGVDDVGQIDAWVGRQVLRVHLPDPSGAEDSQLDHDGARSGSDRRRAGHHWNSCLNSPMDLRNPSS